MTEPYVRIEAVSVPVTDLDRSLDFFSGTLGFRLIQPPVTPNGFRLAFISPPAGTAILVLTENDPERQPGTLGDVALLTDDLDACYEAWRTKGVGFVSPPARFGGGTRHALFHDPDGNRFRLIESDAVSRQLDHERREAEERQERERRRAYEIAIARDVQASLFPQRRPTLRTLDYAGTCLPALDVGGDYLDFLDYGSGKLGFVVGDVSGKGLGAALLMANLQAHVRGQFAAHRDDLPTLLASVNELFHATAPSASYASLFLGAYDDGDRTLTYVNCGHPPGLVLRQDGRVETMDATGFVLGMFERWTGEPRSVQLDQGDVFVLYSDGVTEAHGPADMEFGLSRLTDALGDCQASAATLLQRALDAVRIFGGAAQYDDITIVVGAAGHAGR